MLFTLSQILKMAAVIPASRKGTAKLNELLDIERSVQERWEREKIFEEDAPEPGSQTKYVEVVTRSLTRTTNTKSCKYLHGLLHICIVLQHFDLKTNHLKMLFLSGRKSFLFVFLTRT